MGILRCIFVKEQFASLRESQWKLDGVKAQLRLSSSFIFLIDSRIMN